MSKLSGEFLQIFVAFSENLNFMQVRMLLQKIFHFILNWRGIPVGNINLPMVDTTNLWSMGVLEWEMKIKRKDRKYKFRVSCLHTI
jgi:hypothetical protein